MSASFAMAAVEVAPISESERGPLRFLAGLAAGIRGGSIANTAVDALRRRAPLLVTRTLDLARIQTALLENAAARAAGTGNSLSLQIQHGRLTAELKAVRDHISNLRALPAAVGLDAKETLHRQAVEALADWETRINAPGLAPSQRAALRNDIGFRNARDVAASRTRDLDAAYRAVKDEVISIRGTASRPMAAPYAQNAGGAVRTEEEARALAIRNGVAIPDDVVLLLDDANRIFDPNAGAQYFRLYDASANDVIRWTQFYHDQTGKIPVLIRSTLFSSDEALLANIAHEMYELNRLRDIFAANGGQIRAGRLFNLIDPSAADPFLHLQAWDFADTIVEAFRRNPR